MKKTFALAALSFALAGPSIAMTKDEHATVNKRIDSDYKAAMEQCKALGGNARDVCRVDAKGAKKVAQAEADAMYKPSPRANARLVEIRADAAYAVARERCDDLAGNAKDACVLEAKAVHASAKAQGPRPVAMGG